MNDQQKIELIQAQSVLNPGMNAEQLFTQLTTQNISVKIAIQSFDIKRYLILNDLWLPIKRGVSDSAEIARDSFEEFDQFRIYIPEVEQKLTQILTDLVNDALIPAFTDIHKTAILAMGNSTQSWAEQNMPDLTMGDILRAGV